MPTNVPLCVATGLRDMAGSDIAGKVAGSVILGTNASRNANSYQDIDATFTTTFTVTDTTRIYVCEFQCSYGATSAVANTANFAMNVDGATTMECSKSQVNTFASCASIQYYTTLSAGSHTVKVQWKVDNGTVAIDLANPQFASLVVR